MPLPMKMAIPQQKSLHILLFEKNEYRLYNVQFTVSHQTAQPSIHLKQKWCTCKGKSASQTSMFDATTVGLVQAHKNQCTDQVMSCSYQKQPSWLFAYEPVQTSVFPGSETRSGHTIYILQLLAREVKICLQNPFSVMQLSTSKVQTGIMSMSGEQKILISLSSMKEIHRQWMYSMPFQRFTALSFHGKCHCR